MLHHGALRRAILHRRAHYAPHTPLQGKPDLVAHYPPWDETPHGRQENPIYAAMIESLDESVGRVVAKLGELGLRERTLIIFTSDNGGLAPIWARVSA